MNTEPLSPDAPDASSAEGLLFELPDYIAGSASPEVAAAIERLLQTDDSFRREHAELKATMTEIGTLSGESMAFAKATEATPRYFANFSVRLNERLSQPQPVSLWEQLVALLRLPSLADLSLREVGSSLAAFAMLILMIFAIARNPLAPTNNELATRKPVQKKTLSAESATALATAQYAGGYAAESAVLALTDEETEKLLKNLNAQLPDEDNGYRVLSAEEAQNLLKSL